MNKSIKSTVAYFVKKFDTRDPFEIADRLKVEYIIGPIAVAIFISIRSSTPIASDIPMEPFWQRMV